MDIYSTTIIERQQIKLYEHISHKRLKFVSNLSSLTFTFSTLLRRNIKTKLEGTFMGEYVLISALKDKCREY